MKIGFLIIGRLKSTRLPKKILLDSPNVGVYIPNGIWREMNNFSKNSVCLVLAFENYDENDYIRNYQDFIKMS